MIRRSVGRVGRLGKIIQPDLAADSREQVVVERFAERLDDTELMRAAERAQRNRSARQAASQPAPEAAPAQVEEKGEPSLAQSTVPKETLPKEEDEPAQATPRDEAPTRESDAWEAELRECEARRLAWIDEHVRWRPRGEPGPYGDDDSGRRGRVIVDYDPLDPKYDYVDWDR